MITDRSGKRGRTSVIMWEAKLSPGLETNGLRVKLLHMQELVALGGVAETMR